MTRARPWPARCLAWLSVCAGLLLSASTAPGTVPASPSPHYVYDDAGWLSPATFQSLDSRLQTYERESSSQLVVAIFKAVPPGAEMVDFSQRVFEAWNPGSAGKDNGAILFVFAADRKLRIHTGYGLEGVLPDARCKQIIDDVIVPLMRDGRREAAVNSGVDAIIAATKGEYTGTGHTRLDDQGMPIPVPLLFFIIFVLIVIGSSIHRGNPDVIITRGGSRHGNWGGGWGGGGGGGFSGGGGGGFSGGGGSSGGGGASGGW